MTDLVKTPATPSETIPTEELKIGQWWWVIDREDDTKQWLACCTYVGSNYVEVHGVDPEYSLRVHFDEIAQKLKPEPDADRIVQEQIARNQRTVHALMARVHEITARLSLTEGPGLPSGHETAALVRHGGGDLKQYGKALVKAQKETLPKLFKEIEAANGRMARWMKAPLIALKAEADQLKPVIESIEGRIFNVELYAGLVEQVTECRGGEPAPVGEKIRLLQRRHYMDEESLARYQAGGMVFRDLHAFDDWIVQPDNCNRLLPFPRCVVSFKVRRKALWRRGFSVSDYFEIQDLEQADKLTFLYMRNGDRVFRLSTEIEFGPQLFPDWEHVNPQDSLWGKVRGGFSRNDVQDIITDGEYQARLKEWEEKEAKREAEYEAAPENEKWRHRGWNDNPVRDYQPFNQESVYYDDIRHHQQKQMVQHNRLALVLQGLLDRSPVFLPHPQWRTWEDGGFQQAFELVMDDSRALVSGPAPDFEAYRAKLNKSLKKGCVTVGQEAFWGRREARRENERSRRNRGDRYHPVRFFRPYGNPGPGQLAQVVTCSPRRICRFEWTRERRVETWKHDWGDPIPVHIEVPAQQLLNCSAYQRGDFRQFFDDPRTRANYLQWAPLLLEAEEWLAGNRTVGKPSSSHVFFTSDGFEVDPDED